MSVLSGVVYWYDDSVGAFTPATTRWWWTGDTGDTATYLGDYYTDAYEMPGWVPVHEQWLPLGDGYGLGAFGDGPYGY